MSMIAEVPVELLQALLNMIAGAIQAAAVIAVPAGVAGNQESVPTKSPAFSMSEYRSTKESTVEDYFKRFDWDLQL